MKITNVRILKKWIVRGCILVLLIGSSINAMDEDEIARDAAGPIVLMMSRTLKNLREKHCGPECLENTGSCIFMSGVGVCCCKCPLATSVGCCVCTPPLALAFLIHATAPLRDDDEWDIFDKQN